MVLKYAEPGKAHLSHLLSTSLGSGHYTQGLYSSEGKLPWLLTVNSASPQACNLWVPVTAQVISTKICTLSSPTYLHS